MAAKGMEYHQAKQNATSAIADAKTEVWEDFGEARVV